MRRVWMLGLLWICVACNEKGPPEGAVRVSVNYGSYRPACLRVVARDAQGHEVGSNLLQSEFKDPDARTIRVAVLRQPEWSRELTLEVSSFAGSTGEACSGTLVETHSTPTPILVPQRDFASFEVTLRAKDDDGDTFIAREEGVAGTDCDDGRGEVYPGAAERCSVQVDYDCNGVKGCQDARCQQSACDDGNACTTGDKCEGSGASAQCKGQAVQCEKPAGACSLATCSQETGQCVVTRKQCAAPATTCLEAGVCNESTGNCDYAPKQASVSCDDRQACTTGDACNGAGVCQGTLTSCTASSICLRVTGSCAAAGDCKEEADPSKVNATCALADGSANGVCRATDGKCSRFPYVPSNFDPDTVPTASILPLTTTCNVTFDSTTLTWNPATCVSNPPTPIELSQGSGMVLFALSRLELGGELRLVGNRPVIFAVYGNATLDQNILANGRGIVPGAGGSLDSACSARRGRGGVSSESAGGGGGGAGGATAGAVGGNGTAAGSSRGEGGSEGGNVFVPLVGGCSGGSGGGDIEAGNGGAGGGVVQISVAGTLTVNQRVSASGGGGRGGQVTPGGLAGGGGGGGSGGQVLLEAHQLTLGSSSRLTANGGAGGEGGGYLSGGTRSNGRAGGDGLVDSANPSVGGSGDSPSGGDGGDGGSRNGLPGVGSQGTSTSGSKGGGGGGGGAAGHIRLRSVRPCSIGNATSISPATDTQCPL